MRSLPVLLGLLLSLVAAPAPSQVTETLRAKRAMVVSDSAIASRVGAEVLHKGGNAVDSAVATAFALAVTLPAAGNIGGGGFMLIRLKSGESVFVDYRETAPAAATKDMYLDKEGNVVKALSTVGQKAAGVPGTVAGLFEAHAKYGKLAWADLVEPAIKLAREGFEVSFELARGLKSRSATFKRFPASWEVFCREGKFYEWGDTLKQPDLAKTLERIAKNGRDGFYKGETARLIAEECKDGGGLITEQDLAQYQPVFREPLQSSYKGYDLITAPPPSSGGTALIEMLNILSGKDLSSYGAGSSVTYHWMLESMKRAFADRAAYMGDPDFTKIPVGQLTDKVYGAKLRATISPIFATAAKDIMPGLGQIHEGEHTTHFSVVDAEGAAVSNTYTINDSYGSHVVVRGAGFLLNDEMDDFASKPGVPNNYGLIQGEANSIAPGKRPLSSMTPTIALRHGQLVVVFGSPGGPTIINTVLQTFLNVAEFGMTIQQAVDAPRLHHQWLPDEVRWEARGLSPDTKIALEALGHRLKATPETIGSCQAIFVDPATGHRIAGLDRRLSGTGAAGY
ncbi:MAG: gamma-glutamyltransferase [Armatimonadetes bacterium]|nr:gamma-glutamyltransferase [Armatimonadota bacterium]